MALGVFGGLGLLWGSNPAVHKRLLRYDVAANPAPKMHPNCQAVALTGAVFGSSPLETKG